MTGYIKRELQRVSGRRMTTVYLICLILICILANLAVMAFTLIYGSERDGVLGSNVLSFATWCFCIPYYSCIFIADLTFGKEYPNPQIKDSVTKDLKRAQLYLGKFITELIVAFVFMILAFGILLITTRIFHSDIAMDDISLFTQNMCTAIPLWIAGVAFGNMFLFIFEDKRKAYLGFFVLTLLIPRTIMLFAAKPFYIPAFIAVRRILISQSFGHIPYAADPERSVPFIVLQGLIYTALACIIGICVYNRKTVRENITE